MKAKGKCQTHYCKNNSVKGRNYCHKCRMRKYKEKHPLAYLFNTLKGNAKRRKKEFSLTLEQFKKFCEDFGYMEGKGKNAFSMSIDRIRSEEGYNINNIQILSLSDNTKKQRELEKCPF